MFSVILILLCAVTAIALFITGRRRRDGAYRLAAAGAGTVALAIAGFTSTYTQDVGEAVVLRSVTGELAGQTTEAGLHFKAPWVETITYDTRNNTISYIGTGESNHSGGSAQGPQITFQDREGVTGNLDIVVRYSIVPDAVSDLYSEFRTQEDFVDRVLANDVRSLSRDVPAGYGTLEVFTQRPAIATAIREALGDRWRQQGVTVEEISLQEIRYSDDVKTRFDEAQAARIAVEKARAEQESARVAAETRIITAGGEADANRILSESLTEQVLRQRYIEALGKGGTIYVVPGGSDPLVQIPPAG
ncbi:prohibitin family protein [Pseudonocardia lacus]|uniref:prohibitin family protein n=1 Tax=Pseudonocardia lacus TaxID=2835865 RepID=UPI001BDBBFF9|nr:prohibitin family protein [Pseudonocardia lacus]